MSAFLLGLGAIVVVLGGGLGVGYARRGRSHRAWQNALEDAALRLPEARASAGTRYDGPELRAELGGRTVSLRVTGEQTRGRARAKVALGDDAPAARLWLGWDVDEAPSDWAHVPEVHLSEARVDGRMSARSDDAAFAQRALDGGYVDLIDARREASAHGVVLALRGGYLELELHGIERSSHLLERALRSAAGLADGVERWSQATRLSGPRG